MNALKKPVNKWLCWMKLFIPLTTDYFIKIPFLLMLGVL